MDFFLFVFVWRILVFGNGSIFDELFLENQKKREGRFEFFDEVFEKEGWGKEGKRPDKNFRVT